MRVEEIPPQDRHLYLDHSYLWVNGKVLEIRVSGSEVHAREAGVLQDFTRFRDLSAAEIVWPEPGMLQYDTRRVCYVTRCACRSARRAPTNSHYGKVWDSTGHVGGRMLGGGGRGLSSNMLCQFIQQEVEGVSFPSVSEAISSLDTPGAIAVSTSIALQRLRNGLLRVVHRGFGVGRIEGDTFLAYAKVPLSERVADKLYKLGGIEWRYQRK